MTERLFSTFQIARLLGITLGAVETWMENGSLAFVGMPDGTKQITESALVRFLTEQGIDLGQVLAKTGGAEISPSGDAQPETQAPEDKSPALMLPSQSTPETQQDPRVRQICRAILTDAYEQKARSIHITPYDNRLVLQLRIGARLRDKPEFDRNLPDEVRPEIIAGMMQLAGPDINPEMPAGPRTAEFTLEIDGKDLALRMSALPTADGTRLVIHMPPQTAGLELLGLEETGRTRLEELLQTDGLIVVASKRRTGRDLALQALMTSANAGGTGCVYIGKNPAWESAGMVQCLVDPANGLTYAAATAALEHQDVDKVVLSELRDPNTAQNAFEAAHDGALVIAGTNAVSAAGAIDELRQMGIEPWPMGRTLKAVVEQAAVATICKHCRKQGGESSYQPVGCDRCGGTGWAGKMILNGIVFVENRISELIRTGASLEEINREIAQSALQSLGSAAQRAVEAGLTTHQRVNDLLQGDAV